jgi:hypothetical protein
MHASISGGLPVLGILRLWFLVLEFLGQGFFWVISEEQVLVVLCFVFCLFWHCTLVHFGLFSSLNLMMRSSPARLKKMHASM